MEKKLGIKQTPINAYMEDAYPIAVALSDESSYEWIYSNYIQLVYQDPWYYCNQPVKFYKLSFFSGQIWDAECPLLCYDKITRNLLMSMNVDIVEFICKSIENGKYVKIFLDDYFLSYRSVYKKEHCIHESMFFGYDDEKNKLYGLSYVTDDKGYHFKEFSVDMESVRKAFVIEEYLGQQRERVVLISGNRERFYEFDIDVVKRNVYEYMNSVQSDVRYSGISNPDGKMVFGLRVYDKLVEYYLQDEMNTTIIPLHVLYEHKKLMLDRIKYMMENEYIKYEENLIVVCKEVIEKSYKCKMLYLKCKLLKCDFDKKEKIRNRLTNHIRELKKSDTSLIDNLYYAINDSRENKDNELIYSRWGWWKDVAYPLKAKICKKIIVSFFVQLINSKAKGYIRVTNSGCFGNYYSPFIFRINAEKSELGISDSNDNNYHSLKKIECKKGIKYKVLFEIDMESRRYNVVIYDNGDKTIYTNAYNKEIEESLKYIDHVVVIHENSYRFAINELKIDS